MAEAPGWPGAGPLSYQLVILAASAKGGTARAPLRVRPREMMRARTLIAGMLTLTGTERAGGRPEACWCGSDPSLDSWRAPQVASVQRPLQTPDRVPLFFLLRAAIPARIGTALKQDYRHLPENNFQALCPVWLLAK